jgi:hypothetical protein
VGLERGPLSLVSKIEELLERESRGSGLEIREYGRRDPLRWLRDTLYPQKLVLISQTSVGRSVGTLRSRTQATDLSSYAIMLFCFCDLNGMLNGTRTWQTYKMAYCLLNTPFFSVSIQWSPVRDANVWPTMDTAKGAWHTTQCYEHGSDWSVRGMFSNWFSMFSREFLTLIRGCHVVSVTDPHGRILSF